MANKSIDDSKFYTKRLERKNPGYWWRSALYFLAAGLLAACSASHPPQNPQIPSVKAHSELAQPAAEKEKTRLALASAEKPPAQNEGYQIGAFDLLQIDVFQVPELSQTVRVNSKGYISLPLIGAIQVRGLTSRQLEVYLAQLLGKKYLQNPQVSVFIKEYASQQVTIEGAVEEPGTYPLMGPTTLLQVIAEAEGLTDVADEESVKLFRYTDNNTRQVFSYNLEAIRAGQMPDPKIQSGDIIVVSKSGLEVFWHGFSRYFRLFLNPWTFFF